MIDQILLRFYIFFSVLASVTAIVTVKNRITNIQKKLKIKRNKCCMLDPFHTYRLFSSAVHDTTLCFQLATGVYSRFHTV